MAALVWTLMSRWHASTSLPQQTTPPDAAITAFKSLTANAAWWQCNTLAVRLVRPLCHDQLQCSRWCFAAPTHVSPSTHYSSHTGKPCSATHQTPRPTRSPCMHALRGSGAHTTATPPSHSRPAAAKCKCSCQCCHSCAPQVQAWDAANAHTVGKLPTQLRTPTLLTRPSVHTSS